MLRIFTRMVVGLFWAGLGGYLVYRFGGKLSRHENPFDLVAFLIATLVVLQLLHDAVRRRRGAASSLSDLTFPYALVVTNAIVSYSWLELEIAPSFFSQHRLALTAVAALLVLVLLVFSYFYNKVYLPYIGQSLVALVLFSWGWNFATWLWLSLSIFYSYGYEYARYLLDRVVVHEHNAVSPHEAKPIESFPEAFSFLTLFTFTGLTLAWLQTTPLPFPTWAYWAVLILFMLSLHASWLRFRRPNPIPPRYFLLARCIKRCIPVVLRP